MYGFHFGLSDMAVEQPLFMWLIAKIFYHIERYSMAASPTSDDTLNILQDLIKTAQKKGADSADAVAIDAHSKGVSWREGVLEDVDGSESEDIGLRAMIGQKQAIISTSDRSKSSLDTLVERAMEMARAVPEDEYCGLAPEDTLELGELADLDLHDEIDVSSNKLAELAAEAEDATRAVDGVTNSDGAGAGSSKYSISLVTSHGFAGSSKGSSFSVSVSAIAGSGTGMERDYDFTSARHFEDLDSASKVGQMAGERAVKRLNPTKMESSTRSVLFDPRVANSLLGHLSGAITGGSVARGSSFLKDMMGEQIFADTITITDDPLMSRGLKSRAFDGEGVKVRKTNLIENGVLQTWLLNSASARQLGLGVTGHATRSSASTPGTSTSNLYIAPGTMSPDEMMSDIKEGLYITELIGMGVNQVTGDYSRGAAGFIIRNGEIAESVSEVTIASNLKEMFKQMMVASDLNFKYGSNAPTVRIDGMTVAGA
jgi:PmbA protein